MWGSDAEVRTNYTHNIMKLHQECGRIILDEVMTLWDLENRKLKRQIENTLRLLFHNNNILIISAVPENIKKFISGKLDIIIYKRVTYDDFINGSSVKKSILNYQGNERGSKLLNLDIDEAIIYDGLHYQKIKIPYLKEYDTKINNVPILVPKSVHKNVQKKRDLKKCAENVPIKLNEDEERIITNDIDPSSLENYLNR